MKDFENMLAKAKTTDYAKDKQRSEKADRTKRYEVLAFPSYLGSPIRTNSRVVAYFVAFWRQFSYVEVEIIDHKTGKSFVL